MASIEDLIALIGDKRHMLRLLEITYRGLDEGRAQILKAQTDLLGEILQDLEIPPKQDFRGISHASSHLPIYGRAAAVLIDIGGAKSAAMFPSEEEASAAFDKFRDEIEAIEAAGVTCDHGTADIAFLSEKLLAEPGPHIVYALVAEVRDTWTISLHHQEGEAWAVAERLSIDEEEAEEAGDIWLATPAVALSPKVVQIIIEDLRARRERRIAPD